MSSDSKEVAQRAIEMISGFMPDVRGRRPAQLPSLTDNQGRPLPRYLIEKITGARRENGASKLKTLTTRHLKMLGMRLEGLSLEQIAFNMKCTVVTVSRVLNDPLAQSILKRVYSDREEQVKSLAGPAIEAVREALGKEQPMGVRLRGVDRYAKMREVMLPKGSERESAEDVIARMLANPTVVHGDMNIQVNVGDKR